MAIERVREYFKKWNMEDRILELTKRGLELVDITI